MIDTNHGWNVSYKPQFIGFILSLLITIAIYRIAVHYHLMSWILVSSVVSLAVVQAIFQLIFFMHLGLESKPRWNLIMLGYTVLLLLILIGVSLWIMNNLNYNMMGPQ